MTHSRNVLAVVARYPQAGMVKTRLERTLGLWPVLALYKAFLRDLDARLVNQSWDVHWLFTPATAPFLPWLGPGRTGDAQVGANLAERLHNGMRALLKSYDRAIIMSSDSPQLPLDSIREGFALLERHDVLLCPSDDGGYSLVGLRVPHDIFSGVTMSTPTTFAQTLVLAEQQRLTVALLPSTFDVDDAQGFGQLQRWLTAASPNELPHTRAVLAQRYGTSFWREDRAFATIAHGVTAPRPANQSE